MDADIPFQPQSDEYLKEYAEEAMESSMTEEEESQSIQDAMLPEETVVQSISFQEVIETWEDGVSIGIAMREDMDEQRWNMGALVNFMCPSRKSGRPKDDAATEKTLTEFARDIGEDRSTLSQLAANEEFYNPTVRAELPQQLSWRQLATARTRSGWRRGMKPPTDEHLRHAAQLLVLMAEGGEIAVPPKPIHRSVEDHARKIVVEAEKGMIADAEMGDVFEIFDEIAQKAKDILEMLGDNDA